MYLFLKSLSFFFQPTVVQTHVNIVGIVLSLPMDTTALVNRNIREMIAKTVRNVLH